MAQKGDASHALVAVFVSQVFGGCIRGGHWALFNKKPTNKKNRVENRTRATRNESAPNNNVLCTFALAKQAHARPEIHVRFPKAPRSKQTK